MSKRKRWNKNKEEIVRLLKNGHCIVLSNLSYDKFNYRWKIDGEIINTNSVRAALTELNNGNDVGNAWFIGNPVRDKIIRYDEKMGLLLSYR